MQQAQSILFAKNIAKNYGKRSILKDVSFHFKTGEVVAILGPNGAGKTTSFYILTGIVQPNYGEIFLDQNNITKLPMYMRARLGLGYLPQESSVFAGLSTRQNILAALELLPISKKAREDRLDELLTMFSLHRVVNSLGIMLSGGERRRLEIARALATNPKFILLDEPFAGVDPVSVDDIKSVIKDLAKQGIGVIITDHNVRETLKIADRSYIFFNGEVICKGQMEAVLSNKVVKEKYLGTSFD
jgi:lipopolysaccharide export system ATP-binding protein